MKKIVDDKKSTIMPELLVPAGDFDCVRAGVQNGADCIYFGANMFSARASAKNFSLEELKQAIEYCKIRNVKTNLTLNTLLTDDEFNDAVILAKNAYKFGIDAIIVQDLGFGKYLIDNFPGIEINASTQMSVHNLEGVLQLEKLGFSRVVLSREVPINEIEYIRNNCKVDLEMFIHGALCISYSGQCLFSSMVGGRSGNRGKCAQPCRLPYELVEASSSGSNVIDKGYLLSPKDLCSLEYLPTLVKLGINSFKIEGRMKTPEYVSTVTRIYRKYIDLALSNKTYSIDEADKKDLLQVFNRGGFSSGHLSKDANLNLIYSQKPNNIGLYLGNISNYNANKGHITLKLNEDLSIGDCISIDGEDGKYTVSELMKGNNNLKSAASGTVVKLGRMKGKIRVGAKVYKLTSKTLFDSCRATFSQGAEIKKIPVKCSLTVKKNLPITLKLEANCPPFYNNILVELVSDIIPDEATNSPISEDRLKEQLSKLGNTPYYFKHISINLDNNLHIPSISCINNLRRTAINMLQEKVLTNFNETRKDDFGLPIVQNNTREKSSSRKITLLLENINTDFDYSKIENVDNVYIPLKFLTNKKYINQISALSSKFNIFVYMPTIIKPNYKNLLLNNLDSILTRFNIKGFVISNISGFMLLQDYLKEHSNKKYTFIANYTMNIFNTITIKQLQKLGINMVTPSVELNKNILQKLCSESSLPVELIAYGRTVLMNSSYCLLGKSNKCYPECKIRCSNNLQYYLKDRLGFNFRIMPDNIQTVTAIYNSKITSIDTQDFDVDYLRINILDENIEEINQIIKTVKSGQKLEGKNFTNGNLNKEI
ncbi:MAG: DUF3656 domain-containing protein [Clostridia bacterium]